MALLYTATFCREGKRSKWATYQAGFDQHVEHTCVKLEGNMHADEPMLIKCIPQLVACDMAVWPWSLPMQINFVGFKLDLQTASNLLGEADIYVVFVQRIIHPPQMKINRPKLRFPRTQSMVNNKAKCFGYIQPRYKNQII